MVWGLGHKLHLRLILSNGRRLGLDWLLLWLKLNSDLRVALAVSSLLDLNLCTDLGLPLRLKLRVGLWLELRLRRSDRGNDRRDW